MKISTKGRYGLRAYIDIVRYGGEEPVSISSISARQDISERYLEQLMALLKKAGLIRSIRGAAGGYVPQKDPCEVSVGDVLRALEGDLEPVTCAALHEEECKIKESCVTKYVWKQVNESVINTVDGMMIHMLLRETESGKENKDER